MNVYHVKVETEGYRGGADWLQVTRPTLGQVLDEVRRIVMPGVEVTEVVVDRGDSWERVRLAGWPA